MTIFRTNLLATSLKLIPLSFLALACGNSYAACDAGFTPDPTGFALDSVEDFENTGVATGTYFGNLPLAGLTVSDASGYAGISIEQDCGAQIPVDTTFVQSYGNPIQVSPADQVTRMGFDYGHQDFGFGQGAVVTVVTAVGGQESTHSCEVMSVPVEVSCVYPWGGSNNQSGLGGFVGFDTGDANTHIVSMTIQQPDGGIDNVRCPGCDGVIVSSCSAEALRTDIQDLELSKGLENSLLSKLNAAVATKKSGVVNSAIGVYGAMINQISAKSPKTIDESDAEELITCINELIDELRDTP